MTLTVVEPTDTLLEDLIKLSDKVRDKQRYLEIRQCDTNPNYEAGATPADAVRDVGDQLDALIAQFVMNYPHHASSNYSFGSRLWGTIRREFARRQARTLFDVPQSKA